MKGVSAFDLRCQEYDKPLKWLKFNLYVRFPLGIIGSIITLIISIPEFVKLLIDYNELYDYRYTTDIDFDTINSYIFLSILVFILSITLIVLSVITIIGMFKLKYWAINLWFITLAIGAIGNIIICTDTQNPVPILSIIAIDIPTIVYLYKRRDFVNKKEEKITDIPQESSTQEFLNEDEINDTNILNKVKEPILKREREKIQKEKKKIFCKKCGSEINRKTKKCTGCGKQYFKIKPIQVIISIYTVIIISLATTFSIIAIQQNNKINTLNENIESLNKKIEEQEKTITKQEKSFNFYKELFLDIHFPNRKK